MLYIARYIMELTSPLHCGDGAGDGLLDAPVTRDAFGLWRVPGSSIAGILRAQTVQSFNKNMANTLFGSTQDDGKGSLVWCSDAVLVDFDDIPAWEKIVRGQEPIINAHSFVRDHVRIDIERGAAENGGKFDVEYMPAGTRFAFEVTLDGWMQDIDAESRASFEHILIVLEENALHFGGKTGIGYGQYRMHSATYRHFDLRQKNDMTAWLQLENAPIFTDTTAKWSWCPTSKKITLQNTENLSGELTLPLEATGPILIGGGLPNEHSDADICFATTAVCDYAKKKFIQKYILPGSSLKGILRHRVHHIATALNIDADNIIDTLFGHIDNKNNEQGQRSKIAVRDAALRHTKHGQTVQHVAIDRFTGGAMDAHLFNEAPLWHSGIGFNLHIHIQELTPLEAALLLHTLMDMAEGGLALGSGVNRGNGRTRLCTKTPPTFTLVWNGQKATEKDTALLQDWLCTLQSALSSAIKA